MEVFAVLPLYGFVWDENHDAAIADSVIRVGWGVGSDREQLPVACRFFYLLLR